MTSFKPSDELKQKLYVIIFKSDTKGGKLFDVLLLIVIVFSVLLSMLESIVEYDKQYLIPFRIGEWIITFLFTIEYILRIYCVPNKKKYIFSFYGIIDFLSILPAFISILFSSTRYFSIIRSLRLLRIFRILKLSRYVKESNHLAESIKRSAKKILLFSYFIIIMVTILGAIMYVVENKVNPGFGNIPESVYWAVVTLTTVGYGDITPVLFSDNWLQLSLCFSAIRSLPYLLVLFLQKWYAAIAWKMSYALNVEIKNTIEMHFIAINVVLDCLYPNHHKNYIILTHIRFLTNPSLKFHWIYFSDFI